MNGGLDQQVQQKVDAYRGNPQALMQRYQQNQQLLDLLALQKLKSEKEAAARQMQLQMQQTPQTVAQQREQEVLGLTKQELAQQTQGILQQRQSQQQQNLQRVAQGGIGSLAPQRASAPAPQGQPMPRMAGGGIVAFQEGRRVTTPFSRRAGELLGRVGEDLETERLRQRVQMKYGRQGGVAGLFQPQTDQQRARAQEIIRNLDNYSRAELEMLLVDDMSDIGRPPGVPADYQPGTVAQIVPEGVPAGFTRPLPEGAAFAAADRGPRPIVLPAVQGPPAPPGPGPSFELDGRQRSIITPEPGPDFELTGRQGAPMAPETPAGPGVAGPGATAPSGDGGLASLGVGLGLGGPEAAMRRGFATADEYLGRGEKAARYAEMEQRLAALDEAQYDPAEERRDQLKAFLLGAGGQSTAAGALGAAGRASVSLRADQKAARRKRLMDQFELAKAGMAVDVELGRAGLDLGREMFAQAAANQRAAVSAATSLRTSELNAAIRRGELEYNRLKDDRDFRFKERELEINQAADAVDRDVKERELELRGLEIKATTESTAARQRTTDLEAVTQGMNSMLGIVDDVTERMYSAAGLDMLAMQLTGARDEEARAALESEYARRKAEADASVQTVLNSMGVLDVMEGLQMRLAEIGEFSAPMPSLADVANIEYREE